MVLSLETPVGSNFLKDFPAQNANNMDEIDAYANSSLTTHALKSYTPIFTATTTNPVIGTGGPAVLRAYYYEIFDQIYTWGEFRFGTTAPSAGTGTWIMSLPFNAISNVGVSSTIGAAPVVGTGVVFASASAANRQPVTVHLRSFNTLMFGIRMGSGLAARELTNAIPIAWAPSDGLTWSARFQRNP